MQAKSLFIYFLALLAAPLFSGIINRVKAFFAGRRGQPVLQLYFDIIKLARKGAVFGNNTSWVFRAGPIASLGAAVTALAFVPMGGIPALFEFNGDFLLISYLFGVMRFCTMTSALDTGSSFEGMGASREALFSTLAEPAWLLGMAALVCLTGDLSTSALMRSVSLSSWSDTGAAPVLIALAWALVFLSENSRIPVDDPNTHLELTMIHEVMILDHGGPDLAAILYAASIKMWIMAMFITGLLTPIQTGGFWESAAKITAMMFLLAAATGVIESTMARLKLPRVPQFLLAAGALSMLALLLTI